MLEVQHYLRSGKTFEDLNAELGINLTYKDHLVKLSYDQIESPKLHPITMECRGLVLNRFTYDIVGACFRRFFNYGEATEITGNFNWGSYSTSTKEDGSWISLFHDFFDGKWKVTTRNSFADATIYPNGPTWSELVFEILDGAHENLPLNYTYIFELCSLHNKVVREYNEPKLVLLGIIDNDMNVELGDAHVDRTAANMGVSRPERFEFTSIREAGEWLLEHTKGDPTFEGFVFKDRHGLRIKLKSPSYLSLHHLKGEGSNMFMAKNILTFVIAGEGAELLTYFSEVKEKYDSVQATFDNAIASTQQLWEATKHIEDPKAFALAVKAHKHPFESVVFNMRKHNIESAESEFRLARNEFILDAGCTPDGYQIAQMRLFMKITELAEKEYARR